ncbi:MAG TPA: hypothetical protein VGY55_24115 [Pirellulales bacterium]|jgi:hypothetical protein|nr:hypothetical protein [Pirellulales bacterium]
MNIRDNSFLHAAINTKLASVVAAAPIRPDWYEAWMSLGPESSEEERLKVYQSIRNAGTVSDDAGFYLVAWQIDVIASQFAEKAFCEMDERLAAIERAHGLEEADFWGPNEAPEEYETLRHKQRVAWDRIFADKLQEFGEHELARKFRDDPEGFRKRSENGRQYFHGPGPVAWLNEMVEAVADHVTADGVAGPLGVRYSEEDGIWVVLIYLPPVELIGGANDGEIVAPGFFLDLDGLRSMFDRVDDFSWQAFGLTDDDGPHVSIEGIYQGHEVFLQVQAYAPEYEDPGAKIDQS